MVIMLLALQQPQSIVVQIPHQSPWLVFVTQILPVVLTAAYVVLTFTIVRFTRRAAHAAEQSAIAADQSAKAAAESTAISKEALTTVQRAYVVFDGLQEVTVPSRANRNGAFKIQIANVGNTPVFNGEYRTQAFLLPKDYTGEPLPEFTSRTMVDLTIAPHSPLTSDEFCSLTPPGVEDFESMRKVIFIFCEFKYEDVFGAKHSTKFCIRHSRDSFNTAPFFNERT